MGLQPSNSEYGTLTAPGSLPLIITAVLIVQGFGFLLPNEVRIFKQLISPTPDVDKIVKLGMQNARLAGIQGLFQLAIIFVMANLRF